MKLCLVLGANSDIAKALVRELARDGYAFVLTGRKVEELELFARDLKVRYPSLSVEVRKLDLCDFNAYEELLKALPKLPELTVCAAGYLSRNYRPEELYEEFLKNASANYYCPAAFLSYLAGRLAVNGGGYMVGISSVAAELVRPVHFLYASAKAGFSAFLDGLSLWGRAYGIKVLHVKPGFVKTKMTEGIKVPSFLAAEPEQVARSIARAIRREKTGVLYAPAYWRFLTALLRLVPPSLLPKV
ncbi:MAG: SDR family NAD(P)-dependent oxidoreductase [Aquificae bacterium]|nr:SDR family NAD(P)-dependent oxidoreductase [Aquificota bacterium]